MLSPGCARTASLAQNGTPATSTGSLGSLSPMMANSALPLVMEPVQQSVFGNTMR